jgi:hypothetical protein
MNMRAKILLFLLIAFVPGAVLADVPVSIDIGIICNERTPSDNKTIIDAESPIAGYSGKMCVETKNYISNILIKRIELGYSRVTGTYILLLHSDAKKIEIHAMSESNLMRNIAIIKNHKLVIFGIIGAPLRDGVIPIGVLDKLSGDKLGKSLSGKYGAPSK